MIWFERAEYVEDQPPTFILGIEGRFNEDTRVVSLHLMLFGGPTAGDVEYEVWNKRIGNSMQEENITGEAIYGKFSGKIAQIIEDLPKNFADLITEFQEKITKQAGHPVYFDPTLMQWFANASDLPEGTSPA